MRFLPIILCLALSLPALAGARDTAAKPKTVRLLTIGNSFSANATNHLDEIAAAAGHQLIHRPIVVGGASLELHAGKAQAHEADPKDKEGLYTNGRGLREELAAEAWDFITIQQASRKSFDPATYRPHAGWLRDYIARHAPGAKLLVHQTWAYRIDDPWFTRPPGDYAEPPSQAEMYRKLSASYRAISAELGARLIPVGDAFFAADTDPKWGYHVDKSFARAVARPPALPDQTHSLHVGWKWKKGSDGADTLGIDGHHANLAGEYLGACVWFEVLFGESVVGNDYLPKGLAADDALYLRETAHRTVEQLPANAAVPAKP